jgi:hypothetical protein
MNGNVNPREINYRVHVFNLRTFLNFQNKCVGPTLRSQQQFTGKINFPESSSKKISKKPNLLSDSLEIMNNKIQGTEDFLKSKRSPMQKFFSEIK